MSKEDINEKISGEGRVYRCGRKKRVMKSDEEEANAEKRSHKWKR